MTDVEEPYDPYINKTGSRKLDDGRWEHIFSQSFINQFMHCPEQARATYFRECKSENTDSTSLGRAVHAGIEYDLLEDDLETALEVALHELDLIGTWKYTKLSRDKVYELAPHLVRCWHADIKPLAQGSDQIVERPFNVELYAGKHRTIRLAGTMDYQDALGEPWDWKTASREYERWEYQRWAVQPSVYCYAAHKLSMLGDFEMSPMRFTYGIVCHDGSTQVLEVWRDHTHVAWLAEICSQIAWMIEHELKPWPLNDHGWWCHDKWCPKFAECKGALIADNWTSSQPT